MMHRRVNLRGVLQLDQIEDLLSEILDRLASHDDSIKNLQSNFDSIRTSYATKENINTLETAFSKISIKLKGVEELSMSKIGATSIPASELAVINAGKIQQMISEIPKYAHKLDLNNKIAEVTTIINNEISNIKLWTTSSELSHKIHKEQKDILSRIKGMESLINCKIDRSEMEYYDILSTKLENYSNFKDFSEAQIENLQKKCDSLEDGFQNHFQNLERLNRDTYHLNIEMGKLAPKTEIRTIAKLTNEISKSLHAFVTVESLIKTEIKLSEIENKQSLLQNTTNSTIMKLNNLQYQVEKKAEKEDLHHYVVTELFREEKELLSSKIDLMAQNSFVQNIHQNVTNLKVRLSSETERLDVALRFIEWFTSRGEAYEHNIRLLDKHLGNLATASVSSTPQPYSGQIRFTPLPRR